ncbi:MULTISPECIES: bifunctional acetate--CoA ligase family protein/GNAT family N-acetyltransferase [Cyanophyceae]|uniref:Bifunctional acetate--CoA ligase family protein/GNAT family N-acetyltransferase n=1 Tax=Leptolyngbya subtilissima DQ-A4 TaxID=2933933 RepID=A0ABV0JYX4_9CYAN|nr:bifunctional acetate--CoA ligase family protein/GNAT family N-acetyltransferase [Nodosilinea sp. FACHB-141]MBD2112362.1 bifunctional acetate--CoA ligase family protein/GNAT family N-acetyltransferase [Nodosilinea sp. FACHB-141]
MLTRPDPVMDLWKTGSHPLDPIFAPRSVAVIGATERPGSVGRTVLWNLIRHPFGGTVYPINPKRRNVLGVQAFDRIQSLPEVVDLALIAIPAPGVPAVVQDCVDAGVRGAIILSAGFKEIGAEGVELERQIKAIAAGRMRLIGPNCLGIQNPLTGLNATFASHLARQGNVGFISQSGALCTSILDWSLRENVGFSAFISLGSMLDVGWGDLIDYLGDDPHTHSIVIYMESIGDARSFLSAAREVALSKPIIVIKAGRTQAAAQAAASHTGALTGSDAVLDAAFRRCGVLRVDHIDELFDTAEVLAKQPRPRGPRLSIITNAGGPGVLATDALIRAGGTLAKLSVASVEALNGALPSHWSHGNPIDILGDAEPARFAEALKTTLADPDSDGCLVVLTPQAMTDPTKTAQAVVETWRSSESSQPILASWMGGAEVDAGEDILNRAGIPTYRYPDLAARLFGLLWRHSYALKGLYETPTLTTNHGIDRASVATLLQTAQAEARSLLTETESKALLAAYGIPVVPTQVVATVEEAIAAANQIGYPVVLKLYSLTLTHKTDVGGVQLNLDDSHAVARAFERIRTGVTEKAGAEHFQGVTVQPMIRVDGYELILGSSQDPQFGPVLLFGTGGQLVEVFQDSAIALPPLNSTLARRLMEQTLIYKALQGVRGREAVDLDALEQLLVRFSQLVAEQPDIASIDINPLIASFDRLLALDARVILRAPDSPPARLAIRPYPTQYVWPGRDGVTIRPIRPEDEPLITAFHDMVSEQSVYLRYFHAIKHSTRIAHDRLTRICFNDYDREIALVAEMSSPDPKIIGVCRLTQKYALPEAEFAMLIADPYQGQGFGTELLNRLIEVARAEGLHRLTGEILAENHGMQRLCKRVGFQLKPTAEPGILSAILDLTV